jgi:DNA-directed RNA polymerase I subunit RPA1
MSGFPHPSKKCENCSSFSPILRKDGYTKMFQLELSDGQKSKNELNCTVIKPLDSDDKVKLAMINGSAVQTKQERLQSTLERDMERSSDEDSDGSTSNSDDDDDDDDDDEGREKRRKRLSTERKEIYLAPSTVQRHLRLLWHFEARALSLIWRHAAAGNNQLPSAFQLTPQQGVDFFFMSTIPVSLFCPILFYTFDL